jgi:hypothetical protein
MKLRSLLLLLILSLLSGCAEFRPGFIRDDSWGVDEITDEDFDGPRNGHFDEDGNWIPNDTTIAWTYQIPDISAGFAFDIKSLDATPSIQVELFEFDIPGLSWFRTWKLDAGVAYQRAYGYLGPRLTSIFEISVGGWVGWNWEDNELAYGVGFTIIKF